MLPLSKKIIRPVILASVALMLVASAMVCAAQPGAPSRVRLYEEYDAIDLWGPFALIATEPGAAGAEGMPLIGIADKEGHIAARAAWDGKGPKVSSDGRAWSVNLSADLDGRHVTYELTSTWDGSSKPVNGTMMLVLQETSGSGVGSEYIHKMRLAGLAGTVSEDGAEAVLSFASEADGKLPDFLIITAYEDSCEFAKGQMDISDKAIDFIEASSYTDTAKCADPDRIMAVNMTMVKVWSAEPALSLAKAMRNKGTSPDLCIIGSADKKTVNPGDTIEYTYHIFNAGMEEAMDIEANIPVPEGTELIPSSLSGTEGKVRLIPSREVIDIPSTSEVTRLAGKGIASMIWTPGRPLLPGGTFTVSFKVTI